MVKGRNRQKKIQRASSRVKSHNLPRIGQVSSLQTPLVADTFLAQHVSSLYFYFSK